MGETPARGSLKEAESVPLQVSSFKLYSIKSSLSVVAYEKVKSRTDCQFCSTVFVICPEYRGDKEITQNTVLWWRLLSERERVIQCLTCDHSEWQLEK